MNSLLSATLISLIAGSASAMTVGNDLIKRSYKDGWGNFNMIYTDLVLSKGKLTSWAALGASSGSAALLVVSEASGEGFNVEAVFDIKLTAGEITKSALDFRVEDGWMLGLYQGSGRVFFDFKKQENLVFSKNNSGQAVAGEFLSTPNTRSSGRDYSFMAEVTAVPVPASVLLLTSALVGAGAMVTRRVKKRTNAQR